MTILVTGAAGFFGSRLVAALVMRGEAVIALDRTPPDGWAEVAPSASQCVTPLRADLSGLEAIDVSWLRGVRGVVHAAAVSAAEGPTATQSMLDANVGGTIEALRLARRIPSCEKFLLVSSAAVYDLSGPGLVCEPDATGGHSAYGATKMAAELLVNAVGETFGFDVGIVRPSSLWGPGETWRPSRPFVTAIQSVIDACRRGEAVQPRNVHARRDWLYVDDAAEAAARFLGTTMGGRTVNVATGTAMPFGDVVDAIADVFEVEIDPMGALVDGGDDRPASICTHAIRAATGWEAGSDLRSALGRYRRYLESPSNVLPTAALAPRPTRGSRVLLPG